MAPASPSKKPTPRPKHNACVFCRDHADWVDYKDVAVLGRFVSERGRIRARRVSGNCARHQGEVAVAIKTARELVLLPYGKATAARRHSRGTRGLGARSDQIVTPGALPLTEEA